MIGHPNRGKRFAAVTGNAPFVVTTEIEGTTHFLRRTSWTPVRSRASVFDSVEEAQDASETMWNIARASKIVGEG